MGIKPPPPPSLILWDNARVREQADRIEQDVDALMEKHEREIDAMVSRHRLELAEPEKLPKRRFWSRK